MSKMQKHTSVRKKIFLSNTVMVLVVLFLFFAVNVGFLKFYSNGFEQEIEHKAEIMDDFEFEDVLEDYTIEKNSFILLFLLDGVVCIAGLLLVSQIFTKRLAEHIMKPLDILSDGASRIQNDDFSQGIAYQGDEEFEKVCESFNRMQSHLLEARERNQKYEKARTDMIAGISHDLRTPLTAIRGTIKGLMDGVATSPELQDRFLQTAYRRTEDMNKLLEQLFYLSRLETGNLMVELRLLDLKQTVSGFARETMDLLVPEKERLHVELPEEPLFVQADPGQLYRVLSNLVSNSRKYAEAEPLELNLSIRKEKNQAELVFSDNGVGVPKEKLFYLFDEFYRCDESRHEDGSGLGLYIVKSLIEAMHGSVKAENRNGLTVIMTLPLTGKEGENQNE